MLWLDSCLSTPLIGIRLIPNFDVAFKYKDFILPVVKAKFKSYGIRFLKDNQLGFIIETEEGYTFKFLHDNLIIDFKYQMKETKEPGKLPSVSSGAIQEFSKTLEKLKDYTTAFWQAINKPEAMETPRLGLAAYCNLAQSDMPPGLKKFLAHLSSPWSSPLLGMNGALTLEIGKKENFKDVCIHTFNFSEDGDQTEVDFRLDFQRRFDSPIKISPTSFKATLDSFTKEALDYFEKFGKGGLKYD